MSLADSADVATIVGGIAAFVVALSAGFAFWQYRRSVRTQRAQWLLNLFERFYEKETYREARRDLDWNGGKGIRAAIQTDEYDPLEERWTDYLNFFEFVAYLRELGELSEADTTAMFEYWLRQLQGFRDYMKHNGYDKLDALLGSME